MNSRKPRDFLSDDNQNNKSDIQPVSKRRPRDFLKENEDESQNEGFFEKLPRNVVAGLANAGHTLLNTPHDLAKGFEDQGNQFRKMVDTALPLEKYGIKNKNYDTHYAENIPQQEDYNFAEMLGQKGEPTFGDTLIQKASEYAPEMILAANALRGTIPHLTKRGALKKLKKGKALAAERDIGTLNVNPELIEDARQYLPNNLPERDLLNASQSGDYNSLFKLQSDVGKISAARKGKLKSLFAPETHLKGEAGLTSRNRLLDAIHENLQGMGHNDISDLLRQGQNDYRRYMKFRKYRNIIGGAGAAYAIPKNALTDLVKKLYLNKD